MKMKVLNLEKMLPADFRRRGGGLVRASGPDQPLAASRRPA